MEAGVRYITTDSAGYLSAELALAETELAELVIARKTLAKLTGQTETAPADTTIASPPYQQILTVFATTTTEPMRAKDVCLAFGLTAAPKDTEGMRAKLKRLAARHILAETEPGLFALATATPST